jgi:hypothetical protein
MSFEIPRSSEGGRLQHRRHPRAVVGLRPLCHPQVSPISLTLLVPPH